jgi:hypothetical protein
MHASGANWITDVGSTFVTTAELSGALLTRLTLCPTLLSHTQAYFCVSLTAKKSSMIFTSVSLPSMDYTQQSTMDIVISAKVMTKAKDGPLFLIPSGKSAAAAV